MLGQIPATPFGAENDDDDVAAPDLVGLPVSVQFGRAAPDEGALELIAAELRHRIFPGGWLDGVWTEFITNAHRRLGGLGLEFRESPNSLFRQLGDGELTVLPALRDHLAAHGVDQEAGTAIWDRALGLLAAELKQDADRLLQRVEVNANTSGVNYVDFMRDLEPITAGAGQTFDDGLLVPTAQTSGVSAVDRTSGVAETDGLSRTVLVRQLSHGMPDYSFSLLGASPVEGGGSGPGDPTSSSGPLKI